MPTSLFLAGWTVAVILGLYAFHGFWEARRADLTAVTRGRVQIAGVPQAEIAGPSAGYRMRARLALAASATVAALVLLFAR